jgi:hypothetical protein
MKKINIIILMLIFIIPIVYAGVLDSDADGVPEDEDVCSNSITDLVDINGCSCEQKTDVNCSTKYPNAVCCKDEKNPCIDNCGVVDLKAVCNVTNDKNYCGEGKECRDGECIISYVCGNGICEQFESYRICPKDCELPAEWDWRSVEGENWMTSVKAQLCGDCWAFTAVGVLEAVNNIEADNPNLDLDLSERDLISCSSAGSCDGGSPLWAFQYAQECGIRNESDFPYQLFRKGLVASDPILCWLCNSRMDRKYFVGQISSATNRELMKHELITKGPMAVGLCFPRNEEIDLETNVAHCVNDTDPRGYCAGVRHAMVLVGYNDDGKYWITKNSWGIDDNAPEWAWDGYIKIGYGECYIETSLIGEYWPTAVATGVSVK